MYHKVSDELRKPN